MVVHMNSNKMNISDFEKWVEEQPHDEGFRNNTVVRIVREGRGQGVSIEDLKKTLEMYCFKSGLPYSEALQILHRDSKKHDVKPFISNLVKTNKAGSLNWADLTRDFLKESFPSKHKCNLVMWNSNFYLYEEGRYRNISDDEVKHLIGQFILKRGNKLGNKKVSSVIQEILAMLYGLILIPKHIQPPFFDINLGQSSIAVDSQSKRNWLSVNNGILDLDEFMAGVNNPMMDHTPFFFCFNKLPYNFDPSANCPTWISFIENTFDDKDIINLIQEWFGYNLANHSRHEKFLVAFGKGRNGKSVMLKVLSLMLGEGNFESIGLEAFDPKRTFVLAALAEVKANIVNDLNEFQKTGEGLLKQFVSGEPITAERKYKDPFTFTPTAKISIATNHHVRWSDKSDGIWKRMILINFDKQILDESKQDRRLVDSSWWSKSGELSGVLNWALEGLKRLEKRGHFVIPSSIEKNNDLSRNNANAAFIFLIDSVSEQEDSYYPTAWLYSAYSNFCKDNGFTPMQATNFAVEVKRRHPSITVSDKAYMVKDYDKLWRGTMKSRIWKGLKFLDVPEFYPPTSLLEEQKEKNIAKF